MSSNIIRAGHALRIAIVIAALVLLMAGGAGAATPISACTTISSPGEYVLIQSIINSTNSTCIKITSSNVVFDGAYYIIDGVNEYYPPTYGVYIYNSATTLTNITIKNLKVTDWIYGIYYRKVSNGGIANSSALSDVNGIFLFDSSNNTLINNTANLNNPRNSNNRGIHLESSSNNTLINNTVTSLNGYGIHLEYSSNNTLINNFVNSNGKGIALEGWSIKNTLVNNTANSNGEGIILYLSSNNQLINNLANSNREYGIFLKDSSNNNTIINNTANSNNKGFYLYSSSRNNTLIKNIANSNREKGILIERSCCTTLINNAANTNSVAGISIYDSSSSSTLINNSVISNSLYGIGISFSSDNTLINNILKSNGEGGITISDSNNNILTGNNINSNGRYGIYLWSSTSNNKIYNNQFNNTNNVKFYWASYNTWNATKSSGTNIVDGQYIGGNFWGNPSSTGFSQTCIDSDIDSICDTNYTLTYENIDYLPLALVSGNTPLPTPSSTSTPTPTPTATPTPKNTIPTILDPTLSTSTIYKQGTGTPDSITISYLLADADGIASATLYYKLNNGALQQTSLTRSSGKLPSGYEWWNATIGPFNNNGTVSFYLNATDRTGLSARNPSDGSYHSFSVVKGTVLEPSFKIDNIILTPANPIKGQNTKVEVVLSNVGNAPNPAGTLNLYFGVMDFKNKGAVDSIWASTELYGFNREFSVPEIKNGSSYTITFNDMVFLDSTIPDTLQVTLRYGSKRDRVYFYAKDINVVPDPSALRDCGSAVWDTVVANRIIAEAGIKWALVTAKEYSELAQALKSADENSENGDYASTANDLADITAFALDKHIETNVVYYQTLKTSENFVEPVMLIKGLLENGPQCTDVLFDSQYTAPYIKQIANALGSGIKALIVESPVDLIIEDESGNITGINRANQTFENISNSALIVKGHTKIILLAGNGSYRVRMNGTGSGTFNLTIIYPENNGSASTIAYKEIPVSTSTSASLEFSNRTNFTMSIDRNGDGLIDASQSPESLRRSMPPMVALLSPPNNASSFYKGQNITFSINVTNGTSPIRYRWTSSIDGIIGNISNFSTSKLSNGIHIISSKVYDGAGYSNTTVFSLNISNETAPTPTPTPTPTTTPPSTDVVSRYAGADGIVQKSEAVQAVMDYFSSIITRQEAISVVMAYFTG